MMRPPLTRVDLRMIYRRNHNQADIEALLWEIARLRARVVQVVQMHASLAHLPDDVAPAVGRLRAELHVEPCVREARAGQSNLAPQICSPSGS